jgi:hypothetical protein
MRAGGSSSLCQQQGLTVNRQQEVVLRPAVAHAGPKGQSVVGRSTAGV